MDRTVSRRSEPSSRISLSQVRMVFVLRSPWLFWTPELFFVG
jgi:hypothetical protein